MSHNIGTILVLFILLVIVACSCGVLGRNENRVENNNDRNNEKHHEKKNEGINNRRSSCGCGLGY